MFIYLSLGYYKAANYLSLLNRYNERIIDRVNLLQKSLTPIDDYRLVS